VPDENGNSVHVDGIEVGTLLAVDFDTYEVLVEQISGGLVGKRLLFHDVAPVTSRIADAEEDGLVFERGFLEGFRAPWIPVHGVVTVLEQIRAALPH
jgi:hypothetical protein